MGSDNRFIRESIKGNRLYQKKLYESFAPSMFHLCLRFCRNQEDAEDVMQEAFLLIFNKLDSFDNKGSFEGWIRRIMMNTCINFYRRNKNKGKTTDYKEVEDFEMDESNAIDRMNASDILHIIQKLPDDYRMVFNMYAIEGYSHKDITQILKINENTCRSRLHRARKLLMHAIHNNE
jgi:RNA polymerase sigma factor (sigma-70 family)